MGRRGKEYKYSYARWTGRVGELEQVLVTGEAWCDKAFFGAYNSQSCHSRIKGVLDSSNSYG